METFIGITILFFKVIETYRVNFNAIIDLFGEKNCWGRMTPVRCALVSLGHSLVRVKILGHNTLYRPKYTVWIFKKSWVNIICVNAVSNGLTFTECFWSNAGGIAINNFVFFNFGYLCPFRRQSRLKCEVVRNRAKFRMFWHLHF